VYDPRSGAWTSAGSLVHLGGSATTVLADGSLLVVGGTDNDHVVATVRRFDPDTGTSVEVAPLPAPRTGAIAVRLADGRVLVAGGTVQAGNSGNRAPATSTALVYDPILDAWAEASPMPFASEPGQGLLLHDGSVVVIGGTVPYEEPVTDGCPSRTPVAWVARFVPVVAP
jgi:N-acetylneuraminic acid mutarotase